MKNLEETYNVKNFADIQEYTFKSFSRQDCFYVGLITDEGFRNDVANWYGKAPWKKSAEALLAHLEKKL